MGRCGSCWRDAKDSFSLSGIQPAGVLGHVKCKDFSVRLIYLLGLMAGFLIFSCRGTQNSEVRFAKETFESLARGDAEVAKKIDWPVFTAMGDNLGAAYVGLATEVERQRFITGFITQFATSFRESGGTVDSFTNWRVTFEDSQKTEVAADSPNGVLTLTVSERDNAKRVSSIHLVR